MAARATIKIPKALQRQVVVAKPIKMSKLLKWTMDKIIMKIEKIVISPEYRGGGSGSLIGLRRIKTCQRCCYTYNEINEIFNNADNQLAKIEMLKEWQKQFDHAGVIISLINKQFLDVYESTQEFDKYLIQLLRGEHTLKNLKIIIEVSRIKGWHVPNHLPFETLLEKCNLIFNELDLKPLKKLKKKNDGSIHKIIIGHYAIDKSGGVRGSPDSKIGCVQLANDGKRYSAADECIRIQIALLYKLLHVKNAGALLVDPNNLNRLKSNLKQLGVQYKIADATMNKYIVHGVLTCFLTKKQISVDDIFGKNGRSHLIEFSHVKPASQIYQPFEIGKPFITAQNVNNVEWAHKKANMCQLDDDVPTTEDYIAKWLLNSAPEKILAMAAAIKKQRSGQ